MKQLSGFKKKYSLVSFIPMIVLFILPSLCSQAFSQELSPKFISKTQQNNLLKQHLEQKNLSKKGGGLNKPTAIRERVFTGHNAGDQLGSCVAKAGDVNGDGYDDLIVGAPFSSSTGKAYIYFGGKSMDYVADVIFTGEAANDLFGNTVTGAGDVNGDGYSDVLVSAIGHDTGGRVYVFFGRAGFAGSHPAQTADVILTSEAAMNSFGWAMVNIGDINSDSYDDVFVGAFLNDTGGNDAGRVYVFFGGPGFSGSYPAGSANVIITGEATGDQFGNSVNSCDVNSDGYSDVIVGAAKNDAGGNGAGRLYIFWGKSGLPDSLAATDADVIITGETEGDEFGFFTANAGDVNGDGYSDLIVGAPGNDTGGNNAGRSYLFFGGTNLIGSLSASTANLIFTGETSNNAFGSCVEGAGDVNGDGYSDVFIGAYANDANGTDAGRSYVFWGGANMDNIPDIIHTGEAAGDYFGISLASAGDVNGDGLSDLIVGANENDAGGTNAGRVYLYLNSLTGTDIYDHAISGEAAGNYFGHSVANAGDVNGDGYSDVIVGAYGNDSGGPDAGQAYLFFGGQGFSDSYAASDADVVISGSSDNYLGYSVAGAGDVNGDGYNDVIRGEPQSSASQYNGLAYLFFGGAGFTGSYNWQDADVILSGFVKGDLFGCSVASAGDINGDGYNDVIVGAKNYDNNGVGAGSSYLFLGRSLFSHVLQAENADLIIDGEGAGDQFGESVASAGDLNGDGCSDIIVGAQYNDDIEPDAGRAYVFLGYPEISGHISAGSADLIINGTTAGDRLGNSIACAGDVNSDGYSDVIVGAWKYDAVNTADNGRVFIFFGGISLSGDLGSWNSNVQLTSEKGTDWFGISVAGAGDINGDGYDDVLVGADWNNSMRSWTGRVCAFFGGSEIAGLRTANDADIIMNGEASNNQFGWTAPGAGDINGDGFSDIIVGAGLNNANGSEAGRAYFYLSSGPPVVPRISSVKDVPHDQGGNVAIKWIRSGYDAVGIEKITDYVIQRGLRSGSRFFWQDIAVQTARQDDGYSAIVSTPYDSSNSTDGNITYRVIAQTSNPNVFWKSKPVTGYSVDNLSPSGSPSLLAKSLNDTSVQVTWRKNIIDPDVHHYAVYRSTDKEFLPEPNLLIGTTTDTTFIDTAPEFNTLNYYCVVTFDIHDNKSVPSPQASLYVRNVKDNSKIMSTKYLLGQNYPNPFNPKTIINYHLPAQSFVNLDIYNTNGQKVMTLVSETQKAGSYMVEWNAADFAAGVYFYHLTTETFSQVRKMILVK